MMTLPKVKVRRAQKTISDKKVTKTRDQGV